ncbi:MAG TPA: DUF4912 domain-containing protein [Candidatus Nitrosotenuis sp.]|nr:DUF4912 domain-containing protein [Candidatus Nitrosotenuis sp.]
MLVYSAPRGGSPGPLHEPADLPDEYGRDLLELLPRDPEGVFCLWEISAGTRRAVQDRLGDEVFARCRLVLRLAAGAEGQRSEVGQADLSGPGRSCYLKVGQPGALLSAELGYLTPEGDFLPVAAAPPVLCPWDRTAPPADDQGPVLEELYERLARSAGVEPEVLGRPRGCQELLAALEARLSRGSPGGEP